jgi:hypothetical protein
MRQAAQVAALKHNQNWVNSSPETEFQSSHMQQQLKNQMIEETRNYYDANINAVGETHVGSQGDFSEMNERQTETASIEDEQMPPMPQSKSRVKNDTAQKSNQINQNIRGAPPKSKSFKARNIDSDEVEKNYFSL